MNEKNCPCCPNHCPKDNLECGRGRAYFNNSNNTLEPATLSQKVIEDLRKCGHFLHHSKELNTDKIFLDFSETELKKLHELLLKILDNTK